MYDGCQLTAEQFHLRSLEGFEAGGVTVGCRLVGSVATYVELDLVGGIRTKISVLVDHSYVDEREVFAIGCQVGTVGRQFDMMGLAGCVYFLFGYGVAILIIRSHLSMFPARI